MRGRASGTAGWKCVCRRSASFIYWRSYFRFWLGFDWFGEAGLGGGRKAGTTPGFSFSPPPSFAVHVTAFLELARKTAPRQREGLAMSRADDIRFNQNCAVYFAMLKAGYKRKAKMSPTEYARRLAHEKILQQLRYCDAFDLWRSCRSKSCRRHQTCGGDQNACLQRAVGRVPRPVQWRVQQDILEATPRNIGAPERRARQHMPLDFYE
jgi:hypothetical protein